MSFEAIYNSRGQKVPLFGTLKELKGGGMTANNKPFAKVSITDDTGKTSNVKIYGEALPQAQQIGQRLQWTISTYDYTYQGKAGVAFSGFWNNTAQVASTQQAPSYAPPQQPQAPKTFDNAMKQTYHAEPDRQDDIKFGQAANLAMQECVINGSIDGYEQLVQKFYKFLLHRKMPMKTFSEKVSKELEDLYKEEPAEEPEHNVLNPDDIPF